MKYGLLFLALLGFCWQAFAGNSFGNGGHAVVCRDSKGEIDSAVALDLFEMQAVYGYTLAPLPDTGFFDKDIINHLDRMRPHSPVRTKTYDSFARSFQNEVKFTDEDFGVITDYGDAVIPEGCRLEQAVRQWDYKTAELKMHKYELNRAIWSAFSSNSKKATGLHEIIYRELIDFQAKFGVDLGDSKVNSKKVRHLVASILSDQLRKEDVNDLTKFFAAEFPFTETAGALLYLSKFSAGPVFDADNGEPKYSCHLAMQDSSVLLFRQWLQLSPKAAWLCVYERNSSAPGPLRSVSLKKGQIFNATVDGKDDFFDFETDEFEPDEGMNVVTRSQHMQVLQAGPFKPIAVDFKSYSLSLIHLVMDHAYSFHDGHGAFGAKVIIKSPVNIARPNYEIMLKAEDYIQHEFYSLQNHRLGDPRKLVGEGKVMWKGRWRTFKSAEITFAPYEKVSSVCELQKSGGRKCWTK